MVPSAEDIELDQIFPKMNAPQREALKQYIAKKIKEEICEHLGVYDRSAVYSMPELFWVDAGLPEQDKVTVVKEEKKKSNR